MFYLRYPRICFTGNFLDFKAKCELRRIMFYLRYPRICFTGNFLDFKAKCELPL
jgi:hypothetical protein